MIKVWKKKAPLKLYVWTGVFTDWTSGIAFALASSADEARKIIAKSMSIPGGNSDYVYRELAGKPEVHRVTTRFGIGIYGGG